ncbi:MAG: 2-isopropylmalate synthase, partial [Pseudomonadota bacterium]
ISGVGTATYTNGDIYEGNFLKGKRQGKGTMRYASGEEASGRWEDGALAEQTSSDDATKTE